METRNTLRRDALRALGLGASIAVGVPAVIAVASKAEGATIAAPMINRSAWDKALAARNAAKAAADHYERAVWTPAHKQMQRLAPRPEQSFTVINHGIPYGYTVKSDKPSALFDHPVLEVREKAKEIAGKLERHCTVSKQLRLDDIGQRCDELGSALVNAEAVLIRTPAPDLSAFHMKLSMMFGPEVRGEDHGSDEWCPEYINALMADANRLLTKEA